MQILNLGYLMQNSGYLLAKKTHIQQEYLHCSLVITQMKGAVTNPEVCMLLFLSNTSLKLGMTAKPQQQNSSIQPYSVVCRHAQGSPLYESAAIIFFS